MKDPDGDEDAKVTDTFADTARKMEDGPDEDSDEDSDEDAEDAKPLEVGMTVSRFSCPPSPKHPRDVQC